MIVTAVLYAVRSNSESARTSACEASERKVVLRVRTASGLYAAYLDKCQGFRRQHSFPGANHLLNRIRELSVASVIQKCTHSSQAKPSWAGESSWGASWRCSRASHTARVCLRDAGGPSMLVGRPRLEAVGSGHNAKVERNFTLEGEGAGTGIRGLARPLSGATTCGRPS